MKKFGETSALHIPLQNLCETEEKQEKHWQCIITSILPLHLVHIWAFFRLRRSGKKTSGSFCLYFVTLIINKEIKETMAV